MKQIPPWAYVGLQCAARNIFVDALEEGRKRGDSNERIRTDIVRRMRTIGWDAENKRPFGIQRAR